MGENIVWLTKERFPDKKIIVWAHNYHLVRDASVIVTRDPGLSEQLTRYPDRLMGEVVAEAFGDAIYSIGLISAEGSYSQGAWRGDFDSRTEIPTIAQDSLEWQLRAEGHEWVLLDFRACAASSTVPFLMSGVEHGRALETMWQRAFDGVLFIRTMFGLDQNAFS